MYDILIVGAGLTAATLCASLKHKYKICVVDVRDHIAGNCFDYKFSSTFVHRYGPHFFHSADKSVVDFISQYTEWNEYQHSVYAEINYRNKLYKVPFPYSKETEAIIGNLNTDEVIDTFFRAYSTKMWNSQWEQLPDMIKNRVSKNTLEKSIYFENQFCGLPKHGYTRMIENMIDGVDVLLGLGEDEWREIPSKVVFYGGRIDRILLPNGLRLGDYGKCWLNFRNLDIKITTDHLWSVPSSVLNYCHLGKAETRITNYAKMYNTTTDVFTIETPKEASITDISPFYPIPYPENYKKYNGLKKLLENIMPNVTLVSRLGSYKYIDMDQCVSQAMILSKKY